MIDKITRVNDKQITDWNDYAQSFHSVMPSAMLQVNQAVASYMYGSVADFGCGSGKIIPFILQRNQVKHYTGCLLYTSPSPRDATLSRMPSSA